MRTWIASPMHTDAMARPSLLGALLVSFLLLVSGAQAAEDVRIASFNIQIFGKAKVNKLTIRAYLAEIIRKFDIAAIQEIKDASQTVPDAFLTEINSTGRNYRYVISERTGRQPDDQSSQEQYAYYINADRIEVVDEDESEATSIVLSISCRGR